MGCQVGRVSIVLEGGGEKITVTMRLFWSKIVFRRIPNPPNSGFL